MKSRLRIKSISFCLTMLSTLLIPSSVAQTGAVDLTKTQIRSSSKIEIIASTDLVNAYLTTFRPNSDTWLTIVFPEGVVPHISYGNTLELTISGHLLQARIQSATYLPEVSAPILIVEDALGATILKLYPAPADLPKVTLEGNLTEMKKLSYLLSPTSINGSFTMAIESGRIKYFEKFSNFVLAFREISDSPEIRLASGTAKYAYHEKVELSRPFYTPGIWRLLDKDFKPIGEISSFNILKQRVYPEGHGITTSPIGTPVVMSYITRKVDSSWLDKPYDAPILDCVISQLSNGKAVKSFSAWDWFNSHRSDSKALFLGGERQIDLSRADKPIDFCHANSLVYSKTLKSYIVSLRSLDLILIIDSALKNVTGILHAPGSRQHFARLLSPTKITALGNYTGASYSKLQTWTKIDSGWNLSEDTLPIKISYCGNAQVLSNNHIWAAGGCNNFEKDTAGVLFDTSKATIVEIGRFKLFDSGGSYRVELYKP